MGEPQVFQGTICINKTLGGDSDQSVKIEIQEGNSHARVISIRMTPEQFAHAVFGLAYRPVEFQIMSDPERWGKTRQHKKEMIPKPKPSIFDKDEEYAYLKEAVKPWEVDGWTAAISSALSAQQYNPNYYAVSFVRFVEAIEEEKTESDS